MSRDTLRLIVVLATRNVLAHRVKSLIMGSILFFGTAIIVFGRAFIQSVEVAMETSITSSLAGHLQLYAKDAKDELALFGGGPFGSSDIGEIAEGGATLDTLLDVQNVKAIVPMGITNATVFSGNELDAILAELREAANRGDAAAQETVAAKARSVIVSLREAMLTTVKDARSSDKAEQDVADLERVTTDAFWQDLATNPLPALDFLDSRIAPLAADGRLLYLRTIGTDLTSFGASFDRFYIVDGEPIPEGKRGYLFSKRTYEKIVKNKVARELDAIRSDVEDKGKTIAADTLLQERITRMTRQFQRVTFQLSPADAALVEEKLRAELGGASGNLDALVQQFLAVDDANFKRRYAFFYEVIAPRIQLYDVPVGSVITLRAFTKSGFVRSVNVKVYGTYEFRGLEKSDLQSASNLADLVTFRELYGKMSADQQAELAALEASVGFATDATDAASAEAALFAAPAAPEPEPTTTAQAPSVPGVEATDAMIGAATEGKVNTELGPRLDEKTYTREQVRNGLALNAAVILEDPVKLEATRAALQARIDEKKLNLQIVDWQKAAGILGQFTTVIRVVLSVAVFIIFLVAMVIINNSMIMATMDRIGEIGTMRAVGAQRRLVLAIILLETLILASIAGVAGALVGAGLIQWLGSVGVPAVSDALVILFAGPRLYPAWSVGDVVFGLGVVGAVGLISTVYPAILASRVQPVVAMQGKE